LRERDVALLAAVGYARISRDDTLEGRGVARQSDDITAVCARKGWTLLEVLTDNDVSASRYSRKPRPAYVRLLELIASGTVDRAVVYDVDRLLRQPRQLEDLIDLCEQHNGAFELHNINGELDLSTGSGRFVARVLVSKAAMESDDMSRRLRRSFDQKAAEGRPHGPRAFGYEANGMVIIPAEARLIREAAEDVLAGASLTSIARCWNEAAVKPPQRAKAWSSESVKAVLTGRRQAGLRVHRGEVVGSAAWPAVLDRETHDHLVAHLNRQRRIHPPRRTAFTGLVTGPNGVPLDRDAVKGRPTYRGHRRPGREADQVSIAAEPLERLILKMVFEAIDAGRLTALVADQQARLVAAPDLRTIEDDLRAIAEDFGEGRITRGEWLAARQALERRLAVAQATLDSLAVPTTELNTDLRDSWHDLDVDRQREILKMIFNRVVVHPATRRGGPQPMVEGIGRIDVDRVAPDWRV
jgi:site-specific DNA recombinase